MKSLRAAILVSFLEDQPDYVPANWSRVLECVLLPEVTCHIVSEDLDISLVEAAKVVDESGPFGRLAHPLEDRWRVNTCLLIVNKPALYIDRIECTLIDHQ